MAHATPSAALAWLNSSAAPASGTFRPHPDTTPVLQPPAVLQSSAIGSKGFGSEAGGKGLPRETDCTSVFSASASSKGFSANISGKGIPNNKGFMPNAHGKGLPQQKDADGKGFSANKIGKSKNNVMYYFYNCKMKMDIVAITHQNNRTNPTHALGRSTLPNGETVFYDLIVLKSTVVHGHLPDRCTWDDHPNNNSFP